MTNRDGNDIPVTTPNTTVNYKLPQWQGEDITSWLTQMNDAMNKIDTGMQENKVATGEATAEIQGAVDTANQAIETANGFKAQIDSAVEDANQAIADASKASGDASQAVTAVANVTQELHSLQVVVDTNTDDIGMLSGRLTSAENNITRNTSKSNANETAINELDTRVEALEQGGGSEEIDELKNRIDNINKVMFSPDKYYVNFNTSDMSASCGIAIAAPSLYKDSINVWHVVGTGVMDIIVSAGATLGTKNFRLPLQARNVTMQMTDGNKYEVSLDMNQTTPVECHITGIANYSSQQFIVDGTNHSTPPSNHNLEVDVAVLGVAGAIDTPITVKGIGTINAKVTLTKVS